MITIDRNAKSMTVSGMNGVYPLPDTDAYAANASVAADSVHMETGGITSLISDLSLADPREQALVGRDIWGRALSRDHYLPSPNLRDKQIGQLIHTDNVPERKVWLPVYEEVSKRVLKSSLPGAIKKAHRLLSDDALKPDRAVGMAAELIETSMGEVSTILRSVFDAGPAKRFLHVCDVLRGAAGPEAATSIHGVIRAELRAAEVRGVARGLDKVGRVELLNRLSLAGNAEGLAALLDDPCQDRIEPAYARKCRTELLRSLAREMGHMLATEPGLLRGIAARLDLFDEILRQAVENDLFSNRSGIVLKVSKPNLGTVAAAYINALAEDFDLA